MELFLIIQSTYFSEFDLVSVNITERRRIFGFDAAGSPWNSTKLRKNIERTSFLLILRSTF